MNKLNTEKRAMILRALVEGNSIRATGRMVGCSKNTVSRLLKVVGAHCKNFHDRKVRDVEAEEVQADEIWSFVGKKNRRASEEEKRDGKGDAWTFTALDRDSKLLISYRVAPKRDAEEALAFMVRIPTDSGHPFQSIPATRSEGFRPAIPADSGHPGRGVRKRMRPRHWRTST